MSRFGRLAAVMAIVVLVAACGNTPASGGPGASAPAGSIQVEAKEYAFTPSTVLVTTNSVTFSVKNAGTQEHEFEIFKGETVVDEIEGLVPGLTKTLTVTLEPGSYTFMCKLNGHDQLGMKGNLTVQ